MRNKYILSFMLVFAIMFNSLFFAAEPVYADITAPQNIKIGLSFGSTAANNFVAASEGGMTLSTAENGKEKQLLDLPGPASINVRKDIYYNVVNGKAAEIKYVKAAKYEGDVIGPYHIQVGDVYPDASSARQAAGRVAQVSPTVFLAYEDGWKVWTQLYLDEDECLKQIQVMQNELKDYAYKVVYPDRKRLQVLDSITGQLLYILNSENAVKAVPAAAGSQTLVQYNGLKYRGWLLFQSRQDSDITVINELPFEQYLYSVVPSEMPSSWPVEALKAQAVAARNYSIVTMGRHNDMGFDLCKGEHCQVYNGYKQENSRTNEAVDATKGKLLFYNGQLAATYYHSTSGGHTENSENVWSDAIPYIRGVDDKYSLGSPYDNWAAQLDKEKIKENMVKAGLDVGDILDLIPLKVSEFGRVELIEVKGTKGSKQLEKENIRWVMGSSVLRSIWYTLQTDADVYLRGSMDSGAELKRPSGFYIASAQGVSKLSVPSGKLAVRGMSGVQSYSMIPGVYTFNGKGNGHGLGLSQYGAKGMADAGNNYIQILEYYFQGTKVK